MKICVAQPRPIKGDIQANISNHLQLIELAVSNGSDMIIFPELSLTGYEPALAKELATDQDDKRFDIFQQISDNQQVTIGAGAPIKGKTGTCIGMVLFQPNQARLTYTKKYLHADEGPFFVSGKNTKSCIGDNHKFALAICYELSVPEHAQNAFDNGAEIYLASVAKFVNGTEKALARLASIAKQYKMTVFMSNCVGECDGQECTGKSSVWNNKGELVSQLNGSDEGILIFDTGTQRIIEHT